MRRIHFESKWPESWKYSYPYDLLEIFGSDSDRGYTYAYHNRRRNILRLITEVLSPGATILDIGAAQGNFSLILAELGYCVTWNDLRAELIDYVRLKYQYGQLAFAPGNAFDLEFPKQFDSVLITEIIEHVAHPDAFLEKAASLVKPNGYIFMTTPNGGYFRNRLPKFSECKTPSIFEAMQFKPNADGHIFLLHADEIRRFASGIGLEAQKISLFTNPLTNGRMKTYPLLRILPKSVVNGIESLSQKLPSFARRKLMIQIAARFRKSDIASSVEGELG